MLSAHLVPLRFFFWIFLLVPELSETRLTVQVANLFITNLIEQVAGEPASTTFDADVLGWDLIYMAVETVAFSLLVVALEGMQTAGCQCRVRETCATSPANVLEQVWRWN